MCVNNSVEYSTELVNEHGEESLYCSDTGCSLITVYHTRGTRKSPSLGLELKINIYKVPRLGLHLQTVQVVEFSGSYLNDELSNWIIETFPCWSSSENMNK